MTKKMKDSGIKWIGAIPEDWAVIKVKELFKIGRGRVIAKTELDENYPYPVYSSQTKNDGILGYIQTYDFEGPRLTWTTDGANAGTIFIRDGKYNCTNVCGTLELKDEINNLRYLKYTLEYIAIYHKRADTNGYKIMNNEMANIEVVLPPIEIQKAIADFLDKKTREIDDIISKTEKVIEEYKNYKQSLITETVTKGLNKTVEMKDSGIEWIGEIPEHWDFIKLKYLVNCNERNLSSNTSDDYKFRYIDIGSVDFHKGIIEYETMKYKDSPSRARRLVRKGDVIVSTVRTYLRSIATIDDDDDDVIVSTGFAVLTPKNIKDKYLEYITKTEFFISEVIMNSVGVSYPAINSKELLEIKISFPPLKQQEQIATYLDKKTQVIDQIISSKEKLLVEMEAYKKSLIYETVTGKREVE